VNRVKSDEWTIARWRLQPPAVQLDESPLAEQAPPLWKDLMLASVVALLLCVIAALLVR